ncbi:MAG: hypothetical protein PVJ27_11305 [Candidatus Brocadiaceae bacterium]|jgi:hypothetical protein
MSDAPHLVFEVCGRRLALAVEAPSLVDQLARLFPACADAQPLGDRDPPQFRVTEEDGGFVFTAADGKRSRFDDAVELAMTVEFALTEAFLHEHREHAHVHAGGVVTPRGAVLFLGRAGAGKSSLAFSWCRRGAPALGDDVVMLDVQGRAHAFRRLFKLDPTFLRAAGIPLASTPFWLEGSCTAWWDAGDAAGWAEPAAVVALVIARFEAGVPAEVHEVPRRDALNALAHSLMASGLNRTASFRTLSKVVESAAPLEVRFGSAAEAVDALTARLA